MNKITTIEDLLYLQLFSKLIFECNHFNTNNSKKISNATSSTNLALEIDKRNYPTNFNYELPIFKLFSIQQADSKPEKNITSVFNTIKSKLKRTQPNSEEKFTTLYLNSHYFKHSTKPSIDFIEILNNQKLNTLIATPLTSLNKLLNSLHNNYSINHFWATTEHKSYINRLRTKTKSAIKSPKVANLDLLFSIASSFYKYTNQATIKFYEKAPSQNVQYKQSFKEWNTFLDELIQINYLLSEIIIITLIHKLHFISTLLNTSKTKNKLSSSIIKILSNYQADILEQLCEQKGLFTEIFDNLEKTAIQLSKYDIQSTHLTSPMTLSFFNTKNKIDDTLYTIKNTSYNYFFDYINTCFSANFKQLGYRYLELFYSFIPYQNIIPAITKKIQTNLTTITHILNKNNNKNFQLSTPEIPISSTDITKLNNSIKSMNTTLHWISILGLFLIEKSQYGFFCELLLTFNQTPDLKKLSTYLTMYYSALLNTHSFTQVSKYISHSSSINLLKLFSTHLNLLNTSNQKTPINNSLIPWCNSKLFLNRWKTQYRNQIFNLPKDIWEKLYTHFSVDFIEFSPLLKEWAKFSKTHTQEQNRLNHLIHILSNEINSHEKLYALYILLKKENIENPNFEKIKLNHEFIEKRLEQYFLQTRIIYKFNQKFKQDSIEELTNIILQEYTLIHLSYSTPIVSDLIYSKTSSLIFLLSLSLKYEFKNFEKILNFLSLFRKSNPKTKKEIDKELTYIIKNINLSDNLITNLDSLTKKTNAHTRSFLLFILNTVQSNTNNFSEKNKSTPPSYFSAQTNIKSLLNKLSKLNYNYLNNVKLNAHSESNIAAISICEKIDTFLNLNEHNILSFFDIHISKLCTNLKKVTLQNNFNSFIEIKSQLEHHLNQDKNSCLVTKCLLAQYINACSFLLKKTKEELKLTFHSIYAINFSKIKNPNLFIFFTNQYLHQFEKPNKFEFMHLDTTLITDLFTYFKELPSTSIDTKLIFINNYLKLLCYSSQYFQNKSPKLQERIITTLNNCYQYCLNNLCSNELINKTIKTILPNLNYSLNVGFFYSNHAFLNQIADFIEHKEFLSDTEIEFQEKFTDFLPILNIFNTPEKANHPQLKLLLDKPHIKNSINHIITNNSGQWLNLIFNLLTDLKSKETNLTFSNHVHLLNTTFKISITETQWKNSLFFYDILNSFFSKSSTPKQSSLSLNTVIQEHEKDIIDALFNLIPQQWSKTITDYTELTKSTHPMSKDQILSLIDNSLTIRLSNQKKAISSVQNSSITELIKTKITLDQKLTQTLIQLEELIITVSTTNSNITTITNFITQLYLSFENLKITSSNQDIGIINQSNIANHLLNCINTFTKIETTYEELNPSIIHNCIHYLTKIFIKDYFNLFSLHKLNKENFNKLINNNSNTFNTNLYDYFYNCNLITIPHIQKLIRLADLLEIKTNTHQLQHWISESNILQKINLSDLDSFILELSESLNASQLNGLIKHINNSYNFLSLNNPVLFMYLLTNLKEKELILFNKATQLINKKTTPHYQLLSYLIHPEQNKHFFHNFHLLINSDSINLDELSKIIQSYIQSYDINITTLLEFVFYYKPNLFHQFIQHKFPNNVELVFQTLINHDQYNQAFKYSLTQKFLNIPYVNQEIPQLMLPILSKLNNYCLHPALLTYLLKKDKNTISTIQTNHIKDWVYYSFKYEPLEYSFKILKERENNSIEIFVNLFLQSSSENNLPILYFLTYLNYLTKTEFITFVSLLEKNFNISINEFCTNLFSWINETKTPESFTTLLLYCESFFNKTNFLHTKFTLTTNDSKIISMSMLKHSSSIQIETLITILKNLNFLPLEISSHSISLISTAIQTEEHHLFLLDLAIQNESIFNQLLQIKEIAISLQQSIFYNKFQTNAPLFNQILNRIKTFSFFEAIHFAINYSSKKLSQKKIEELTTLLYSYVPQFPNSNFNTTDTLKDNFLSIVNTPIFSIAITDLIIEILFSSISKSISQINKSEHILYYLISNSKINSYNDFSFTSIKNQIKLICSKKETKLKLLSYLQKPSHQFSLNLFTNLIEFWKENQSLIDLITLHISDADEAQDFQNFLIYIASSIPKYYIYTNDESQIKKIFKIIHYLIANNINTSFLVNWIEEKTISNNQPDTINYLTPIILCNKTKSTTKKIIIKQLIKQSSNQFPIKIMNLISNSPIFHEIWDYYLRKTKKFIILSNLINQESDQFKFLNTYINYCLKYNNQNFFRLCSLHIKHDLNLELFFKELFDTAYINSELSEDKNLLIATTKKALTTYKKDYLITFAKSTNDYKFKHNFNWLTQAIHNLYRIKEKSHSKFHSNYIRLLLKSKIISDNGEFLINLTSLSWEQLVLYQNNSTEIKQLKPYFLWLKNKLNSNFKTTKKSLTTLFNYCPSLLIPDSPKELKNYFTNKLITETSFIESLISLSIKTNQIYLSFTQTLEIIQENKNLTIKLNNYLNQIDISYIYPIIIHKNLNSNLRYFLLKTLLNPSSEEKASENTYKILSQVKLFWTTQSHETNQLVQLEILIFIQLHFPKTFYKEISELFPKIIETSGINFPKIIYCKTTIDRLIKQNQEKNFSTIFNEILPQLNQYGFNLFDIMFGFRLSIFYSYEIEQTLISKIINKKLPHNTYSLPNWLINLHHETNIDSNLIYIKEDIFNSTALNIIFKEWLIKEGHLDSTNILSIKTYTQFKSLYNIEKIYTKLIDKLNSIESNSTFKPKKRLQNATNFFTNFFKSIQQEYQVTNKSFNEIQLILNTANCNLNYFEIIKYTTLLNSFNTDLKENNISNLLKTKFIPLIMNIACNYTLTEIDPYKLNQIIKNSVIYIDINHNLFSALSKQEKESLISYIIKKKILDPNTKIINEKNVILIKQNLHPKESLYNSYSLLEKYISIQKQITESFYITLSLIGLFSNTTIKNKKSIFIQHFASLHDHEWIYFKNLLNQNITNSNLKTIIKEFLEKFNITGIEITQKSFKKYALKLKSTPIEKFETATTLVQSIYTANKSSFQTKTTETKLVIDLLEHISEKVEQNEIDFVILNN